MLLVAITGASQGIGRAIALAFAPHASHLALVARSTAKLEAVGKEATRLNPDLKVLTFTADLTRANEAKAFAEAVNEIGPVDVLVNNAGMYVPGQIQNEPEGVLETQLALNVHSAYHVTRGVLPHMLAAGKGHIFTICSTASIMPYVNGGSYCISKFALLGFSRVLREELKTTGIRVTSVLPGGTETASWDGSGVPSQRLMPPEEVAAAILGAWQMSPRTVIEELLLRPQLGDL